jgi:hypothetical protein
MLGKVEQGDAIKMFVLPHITPNSNITSGLLISTNRHGAPLVSRVVLERTNFKHSNQIRPRVVPCEDVSREVQNSEIIRRLRNYTSFEIGTKIYSEDLKENVSAERVVKLCGKYCGNKFTIGGKPFNPADHRHYLFNQALLVYDPKERYTPT